MRILWKQIPGMRICPIRGNGAGDSDNPADVNCKSAGGMVQKASGSGEKRSAGYSYSGSYEDEQELQAIFERTFGPVKRDRGAFQKKTVQAPAETKRYRPGKPRKEEYLLVDGYNIIFSWDELRELAEENIHAACDKLKDILSNYQGYRKCTLILVFDAYKVEGHQEEGGSLS